MPRLIFPEGTNLIYGSKRLFKRFGFLTKKDGLRTQEFIDYYENHHVPLICSLAPVPTVYERRYLVGERLTTEGGEVDFDVMTELVFADRRAFDAWMAELAKPWVWRTDCGGRREIPESGTDEGIRH